MGTPFKLKSGNASSFKNLGSSPVKETGDNLKRIATEKKELAKKTGTWYREGAGPKPKTPNVKGFNTTGTSKAGKFIRWAGSKTLGVLGMMGAGTLSASATPTGNQKKKGTYTSDIQDIIPKKKETVKTYPTRKFPTRKF